MGAKIKQATLAALTSCIPLRAARVGGRAGSGWGRAGWLAAGSDGEHRGSRPARGLAGPLGRRRRVSAVRCAPTLRATVAGGALHHPFYSPRAGGAPNTLGYQSQADVMLLMASPANQQN